MSLPKDTKLFTIDKSVYFLFLCDAIEHFDNNFRENRLRILEYKTKATLRQAVFTNVVLEDDQVTFVRIIRPQMCIKTRKRKHIYCEAGVLDQMS